MPCPALGRGPEFHVSVLYHLGVFDQDGYCVACGCVTSDSFGHPAIIFGSHGIGERIARHNLPRNAIYATTASAHLAPIKLKEDRALLPGCDGRPADVLIHNYMGGLHMQPLKSQSLTK